MDFELESKICRFFGFYMISCQKTRSSKQRLPAFPCVLNEMERSWSFWSSKWKYLRGTMAPGADLIGTARKLFGTGPTKWDHHSKKKCYTGISFRVFELYSIFLRKMLGFHSRGISSSIREDRAHGYGKCGPPRAQGRFGNFRWPFGLIRLGYPAFFGLTGQ